LKTIHLPKNLSQLGQMLPRSKYATKEADQTITTVDPVRTSIERV